MLLPLLALWTGFAYAIPTSQYQNAGDSSLLWGPYRPNLYVGIRPRGPESLLMGLMWGNADKSAGIPDRLRHTCEQDEGMAGYGWAWYDARNGGQHVVNDTGNALDMVSHFIKRSDDSSMHQWSLKVQGFLRGDAHPTQESMVVFYVGNDAPRVRCRIDGHSGLASPGAVCHGSILGSDNFTMLATSKQADGAVFSKMTVTSATISNGAAWQAKQHFVDAMKQGGGTPDSTSPSGTSNLYFIHQTFQGAFELTIHFTSASTKTSKPLLLVNDDIQRTHRLFEDRFRAVYKPQPPFRDLEYARFSQSLISNLMGGIGYFYGTSKVAINREVSSPRGSTTAEEKGPYELLSAVPSRPFFPRGFLWDEGFHLQGVLDWDLDLAIEIIMSCESKVPPEFQVQNPEFANPPTLFIAVDKIIIKMTNPSTYHGAPSAYIQDSLRKEQFMRDVYTKMKLHYNWFRRTQAGDLTNYQQVSKPLTEGYWWRGRTARHTLTSGLDDYPRAQPPHAEELHVDALSWVGVMAVVLQRLAGLLRQDSDVQTFSSHQANVLRSLAAIHWSERDQAYCDTTTREGHRVEHVCHKGYVTLIPFAVGLLRHDHPHLGAVLDLLHEPAELWSAHSIRSLSLRDRFYGTDENYWRGPIWVNINYVVLERLLELATGGGPYRRQARDMYAALRVNVVDTVFRSWRETGFAWEQYHPDTGRGQRTQHFTGWTALVARIMAMPDLGAVEKHKQPDVAWRGGRVQDGWAEWLLVMMVAVGIALSALMCFRRQVLGFLRVRWTRIRGQRW